MNFPTRTKIIIADLILFLILVILGIIGVYKIFSNKSVELLMIVFFITVTFIYKNLLLKFLLFDNFKVINEGIKKLALKEGDLIERLPVKRNDEISIFSRHHNIFIAKIHNIIFKLKNIVKVSNEIGQKLASSSSGISSSTEELTATTNSMKKREQELENHVKETKNDVSDIKESISSIVTRINDQATAISESSSAVEETIASINNLNHISTSKKKLILSLTNLAKTGEEDMAKTLDSIKKISESIGMINNLITVINDIATQTNILSMNAAIEAAHAGKYGSGFNVVANEIRGLAETTTKNSKNISKSLTSMISQINESANLTEKTDKSIKQMIDGIQDVADSMNEISNSLNEMSSGTNQITVSLGSLHKITNGVQDDSNIIDEKSRNIYNAMEDLQSLSEQSNISMNELAIGINEIKEETNLVAHSGNMNLEYINIIKEMINNFKIIDTSNLMASDGQPLIQWNKKDKEIPEKPKNISSFSEDDSNHWYDMEFAGWGIKKNILAISPADGTKGKYVICFQPHNHPYQIAYEKGIRKIAEAFGIKIKFFYSKSDFNLQKKQVDMAIREKPDLIVLAPVQVTGSTELFNKINYKCIPVIASNLVPENEALKSVIAMTGPDDWRQSRIMAKKFAELMNYKGGYCLITHIPGTSCYYGRAYGIITELKKIAPDMKLLEMEYTEFNPEKTETVLSRWIEKHQESLRGIVSADDSSSMIGVNNALKMYNRSDIIRVAICNSKTGLDFITNDLLHATSYQSAEGDGALSIEVAIDWFNGLDIAPVRYLPTTVITKENVDNFYPAQW